MNEQPPKIENKMTKEERIQLAKELSQNREGFKFGGLDTESYTKLKAADDEYPGFTTPIDELIIRLTALGMKISLGDHPESGNVFILPLDSEDVEKDSVFPRHLIVNDDMDPELKKLVLADKESKKSQK